jgi:hypothetical protein
MGIPELTRAYAALPARDQVVFAAFVRAHQTFNTPAWKADLALRHAEMDAGQTVPVEKVVASIVESAARREVT